MRASGEVAPHTTGGAGEGWVVALALRDPETIARRLGEAGCSVVRTAGRMTLVRAAAELAPDGILLEIGERDADAVDLVRTLTLVCRARLVVLVAGHDPSLPARLFEAGAADVVAYDVAMEELIARLRARLQEPGDLRRGGPRPTVVRAQDVEIDRARQLVRRGGEIVNLTGTEYRVLDALAAQPDEVVPLTAIAAAVWGDAAPRRSHAVRVYVSYLRRKLEVEVAHPRLLVSHWGKGYQLNLGGGRVPGTGKVQP